jgi:hypothetical protein
MLAERIVSAMKQNLLRPLTRSVLVSFVASIAACSGSAGSEGPQGPSGTPGAQGAQGTQGMTGPSGNAGPTGPMGSPGASALEQRILPGAYYPESMNAGPDGTLYVGSLTTGEVVALGPSVEKARVLHAAGADGIVGVAGVLVDSSTAASGLWICSVDFSFMTPTFVRNLDISSGMVKASFPLPATSFCNDLVFDARHNLYVTDSFSPTVFRLASGATTLEPWVTDPRFRAPMGQFGLDGICLDDSGSIIVNRRDSGQIFQIAVDSSGASGMITEIAVHPALAFPDGMRCTDHGNLLVVEGAPATGRLSYLTVSGTVAKGRVLDNRLDFPTAVVRIGDEAWVTEGQFQYLFGAPGSPSLPFLIRRVIVE